MKGARGKLPFFMEVSPARSLRPHLLLRQLHDERAAIARCALDANASSAQLQDAFDDGQAKTVALAAVRRIALIKLVENVPRRFRVHAGAMIADLGHDPPAQAAQRDGNFAALRRKLNRVGKQVQPDMIHHILVAGIFNRFQISREDDLFFQPAFLEQADALPNLLVERIGPGIGQNARILVAAQEENVPAHLRHPLRFAQDGVQRAVALGGGKILALEQLGVAADGHHRRFELMRKGIDEIRPLNAQVDLLPRVHGSGMFTRGQTQVLSIATLGTMNDAQQLDGLDEQTEKRYIHHYNFPSYSVGETKPSRGPGRREIGHGALAEKALVPVIPPVEEFPYSIRVVSEVLSSNGSTSQGSICGSTLALMAAGVPIKAPVAGISCGLITGDEGVYGDFMTMVDIQGLEDFYGDMDFKVAGTKKGITAIQMDLKVHGLTPEIIKEAFAKTNKARNYILDEVMLKCIPEPRAELSKYAPKMLVTVINPEKIGDVIGKQGKVIQKLQDECNCTITIEEDGKVFVSSLDYDDAKRAISIIETIANDPEVGAIYNGVVTRLMSFGAFVEIAPGKEGLVHISQLDVKRTEKVEDVVQVGDQVIVKVTEIDDQGRLNLSRREALIEVNGAVVEDDGEDDKKRNKRPHNHNRHRNDK